ncbi:MAG: DUF3450 family protein [Sedimentisphaerales bacterium]|nr:DUF3450 family protein [Sedimentisphaerales bacterium]
MNMKRKPESIEGGQRRVSSLPMFRFYGVGSGLILLVCILSSGAAITEKNKMTVEGTRGMLEKWIEIKRIISKEKRDFELAREILKDRTNLVQQEIESLHGKIIDAENSIAEADKKRSDMVSENEKFRAVSSSLGNSLALLEQRTQQLVCRLPDPIQQRLKPLSQRLPTDPEQTKLSLAERFQNVVGILNEVDKSNREITVCSEVRTLPDGSSVEVASLYIGIGQAFYANANGTIAGTGKASEKGWVWKPSNEAAPQILEAIAILKNEKVATYIKLPVEIQ